MEDNSLPDTKNNEQKERSPHSENTVNRIGSFPSTSTATSACDSHAADDEIEDQPRHADDQFARLSPEVIIIILSYLSLRDLKTIRLTSKTLHECSKRASITKGEKLVFPSSCQISSLYIGEILSRTKSALLNLEFRGTRSSVKSLPVDIWKICGSRVCSLYLRCSLETQILVHVFMNCGDLQSIECYGRSEDRGSLHLEHALDHLIQSNVSLNKLHTLKFYGDKIDSNLVKKIFAVFPNLKHLHAGFQDLELGVDCQQLLTRLQGFSYLPLVEARAHIFWTGYQSQFPMRLTEFHTIVYDSILEWYRAPRIALFSFLEAQNELEELAVAVYTRNGSWSSRLMLRVLRSSRKLRRFQFDSPEIHLETSGEVTEFLNLISTLRGLQMRSLPRVSDGLSLPPTNFALNTLKVKESTRSDKLLLHLLKNSPRMRHVAIGSDLKIETFKEMYRDMPELRTLQLGKGFSGYAFARSPNLSEDELRINGFQSLEYLGVDKCSRFQALAILQDIPLRRMKHVKLTFEGRISNPPIPYDAEIEEYRRILWNMPALETAELLRLKLESEGNQGIELFQPLKNLRRLICEKVEKNYSKRLFRACPNLKFVSARSRVRDSVIILPGMTDSSCTFSFDSSAKRVIKEAYLELEEQGCRPLKIEL